MEYEHKDFASKGVAGAGLGLGIAGTALGVLNGGLGNIFGGWGANGACHESMPLNRYEAQQQARIAELLTEVKLRDANTYTDGGDKIAYTFTVNSLSADQATITFKKN